MSSRSRGLSHQPAHSVLTLSVLPLSHASESLSLPIIDILIEKSERLGGIDTNTFI